MNIAVCLCGVNDKDSNIVEQLKYKFPEAKFYFHTWTNKTHLIDKKYHKNLKTLHYPKWHYHPMDVDPPSKHAKYLRSRDIPELKENFYFGLLPLIQYFDLLKKVPAEHDLIIKSDFNIRFDRQVDLEHHIRVAYEKGPVGFLTRSNRGAQFGSGKWSDVDKENPHDDWYNYMPGKFMIHNRRHANHRVFKKLLSEKKLYPDNWGWYQVMSQPFGDNHHSYHGLVEEIK